MKTRREFLGAMAPLALGSWLYASELENSPVSDFVSSSGLETLFLTWASDPTRTMRLQWISARLQKPAPIPLLYRSHGEMEWKKTNSSAHPFGGIDHWVNRVDLNQLTPGSIYEFKIGDNPEIWRFKTAPEKLDESVIFAEGGDIGTDPLTVIPLHRLAASWNPLFGLVGGDLAYSNGSDVKAEIRYFKLWNSHMRSNGNRLIPMVVAIGNHEVRGGYEKSKEEAPFFYALFDGLFSEKGAYGVLDFGQYFSLILLDSQHTCDVRLQTQWLKSVLEQRKEVPHRVVAYHVPAYPSSRKYEDVIPHLIRTEWVPVMENAKIKMVFEHHDHSFKRSKKILQGEIHPDGITYLGNGDWGQPPRPVLEENRVHLEKGVQSLNVLRVTLSPENIALWAGNEKGDELDQFIVA
ncbi:MAG: fibronectin type III domain-containing protein [Verrucomicrobiota bacterium]